MFVIERQIGHNKAVVRIARKVLNRMYFVLKNKKIHNLNDLQEQFAQISARAKKVREELYRMLVEEAKYFG